MANQWNVLPHQPIEKIEDNLWRVEGNLPKNPPIKRVMTIAKLNDSRLVIHNAICVNAETMREVESFGKPAFLIVPGVRHRLDAAAFKSRHPDIVVVSPPGAKKDVEKQIKVDTTQPDFGDDSVRWHVLDGVGQGEGVLEVRTGDRVSLVFNDAVMNMRPTGGFMGMMFGLVGFTGEEPRVSGPTKFFLVKDRPALRSHLERLASTPQLARVIVAHGAPFDAAGLKTAAATL
ncbi:MAG: hypothetical protein M3O46_04665 [Myxococcota bacterium]|nr:hypothetical protein [Myxococcota bacterium]